MVSIYLYLLDNTSLKRDYLIILYIPPWCGVLMLPLFYNYNKRKTSLNIMIRKKIFIIYHIPNLYDTS